MKPPQLGAGRAVERWTAAFHEPGGQQWKPVESMNLRSAPHVGSNATPGEEAQQNQQERHSCSRLPQRGDGGGAMATGRRRSTDLTRGLSAGWSDSPAATLRSSRSWSRVFWRPGRELPRAHVQPALCTYRSACAFAESSHLGVISQSITFDTMRSSRVEATRRCHVSLSHAPAHEGPCTRVLAAVLTAVFTYPQNIMFFVECISHICLLLSIAFPSLSLSLYLSPPLSLFFSISRSLSELICFPLISSSVGSLLHATRPLLIYRPKLSPAILIILFSS